MTEQSETQTEAPVFSDGDTLTIKRGKFGGQSGTVLIRNLDGRYVVKLGDGNVTLVEPQNTKTPPERTFTKSEVVQALKTAAHEDGYRTGAISAAAHILGLQDEISYPAEGIAE